jgi:hypothetical protein
MSAVALHRQCDEMIARIAFASVVVALASCAAWAQQPATVRIAGTVESFDGHVLAVKSDKLGEVKVNLPGDLVVFAVSKGTLADVKAGAYIGAGAMPQADGSQRAIQLTVFAESLRGIGEGFRPWSARPNSTMTNGAVEQTVESVDGRMLTVKYKGGEQKIVVPADAVIQTYTIGDRSELKPGAHIAITRALKKPDGTLEADRVNVGRGEVVPQ